MSAPSIGANKYKLKLIHSPVFAHATGEIQGRTPHTAGAAFVLPCLAATPGCPPVTACLCWQCMVPTWAMVCATSMALV